MNAIELFVVPALDGSESSTDVEDYLQYFECSIRDEMPPYFQASYGDSFRQHIENPVWVIQSLVSNAIKEGEGSRDIAKTADQCESIELTSDLAVHVRDEARHCRMYVQLIDYVFPNALSDDVRAEIVSRFPPATYKPSSTVKLSEWKILDYLIQINLGEVRTRLHQKLLEPVLFAYCPLSNQERLCSSLCKLRADECCHVQYTASRIGALARSFPPEDVQQLFRQRLFDFNRYTERELGSQKHGLFGAPLIRDR